MALAGMIGLLSSSLVMRTRLPVAQPSLAARSLVVCSAGVEDKIQSAVDASKAPSEIGPAIDAVVAPFKKAM